MLTEPKKKAIEYLLSGVPKTEIAKMIDVSRQRLYDWLKEEEFKAEYDKGLQEIQANINDRRRIAKAKFNAKLDKAVDGIWYTIEHTNSEKVKADLLKYWIDRELGTPTKVQEVISDNENKENNSIDDFDNMVDEMKQAE